MLGLTGVLGLIVAGAASLFTFSSTPVEEEETAEQDVSMRDDENLLELLDGPIDAVNDKRSAETDAVDERPSAALAQSDAPIMPTHIGAATDEILFQSSAPLDLQPFLMSQQTENTPDLTADIVSGDQDMHQMTGITAGISPSGDAPLTELSAEEPTQANSASDVLPVDLREWIAQRIVGEVVDYTAEKEQLMLVWDDMSDSATEPDVSVADDPFDTDVKHITLNGQSVAQVYGDPDLNVTDVAVIPLSSALIAGLEPV